MSDWRVEEPENLFPTPRDAALYLAGLAGFWGGVGVFMFAAAFAAPSVTVAAIAIPMVASMFLTMRSVRKLDARITGREVRSWPLGYSSFRAQVTATLPSTVIAAAQRLSFNAVIVAVAMYSLLIVDFVAFLVLSRRR
jgi:hypothetical protein